MLFKFPKKPQPLNCNELESVKEHYAFADQFIKTVFRLSVIAVVMMLLHLYLKYGMPTTHPYYAMMTFLQRIIIPSLAAMIILMQGLLLYYRHAMKNLINELTAK